MAIGVALAVAFGAGLVTLGLADGRWLRVVLMLVLAVAIGAAVLAMDEARITEAKVRAELSRERADRARVVIAGEEQAARLMQRIDDLEHQLRGLEREVRIAPRTTVVVAPDRRPVARIIELPDAVPAALEDQFARPEMLTIDLTDTDLTDADATRSPGETLPLDVDVDVRAGDAAAVLDDEPPLDDDFPVTRVVGEFSLDGLAAFPRPAGMPGPRVIDLRDKDSERTA
jgi:hypothetical protein